MDVTIAAPREGVALPILFQLIDDRPVLFVTDYEGVEPLRRFCPRTGSHIVEFEQDYVCVNSCAVVRLQDGDAVLGAGHEDGFCRCNARTGTRIPGPAVPEDDGNTIYEVSAAHLPDGRQLFVGAGNDHLVYRWDAATGRLFGEPLAGHEGRVLSVCTFPLSNGSTAVASGGDDGTVRCWNVVSGELIGATAITGTGVAVTNVESLLLDSGRVMLVSTDTGGNLCRWDAMTGEAIGQPVGVDPWVTSLSVVPCADRPRLITSGEGKLVRQWDAVTGTPIGRPFHGDAAVALALPDESALVAFTRSDGSIQVSGLPNWPYRR